MPRATVTEETQKFPLESLEGGFVELRTLNQGEWMHRRDMVSKMSIDTARKEQRVDLETLQSKVTQYEFEKSIVDHNLEDERGRKLNFANQRDFAALHPKIGGEIEALIGELHNWANDQEELFREGEDVGGDESSS